MIYCDIYGCVCSYVGHLKRGAELLHYPAVIQHHNIISKTFDNQRKIFTRLDLQIRIDVMA